ncbi:MULTISPECIES: LPD11 domain-containing protein [Desulfitobacterium]|uniref:Large polyvalent protein-associated domain-containing protein n=1 Tax=Desulfitobacterium chlororespirans DSM 11544 TaxID=1121395 RepID=A0A1M7UUA0_9FIRM|nr:MULTISPECIES: LPD11 domain-containing protein [Desulfitobacterium]SHN86518.1 hypothetical protein SAMN02745215_04653 [Desulfitobacterium chlororespirans DSM 11544]
MYDLKWILDHDDKYRYQLLDRMRMDCAYYLGNGQIYENHLWADNEKEQIEYMKAIWNSFPAESKPEWLTYEQILECEEKMMALKVLKEAQV